MNDPSTTSIARSPTVAVCYLARCADGTAPLQRFVESYRNYPAGLSHDRVILFKGFSDRSSEEPWRQILSALTYQELHFEDVGFADRPFFRSAFLLNHDYFLFLNTWSHFLAPDWLAKLFEQVIRPGVGMVGATSSCESHYTSATQRLTGGYPWPIGRQSRTLRDFKNHYAPYPNFHLRTNGLMVSREVIRQIQSPEIHTKEDAHRLESGRNSLTNQIKKMGLTVYVVGRDGQAYGPDDAWNSRTFRSGQQENLLIGDNQTASFDAADPSEKARLARMAWGERHPQHEPSFSSSQHHS